MHWSPADRAGLGGRFAEHLMPKVRESIVHYYRDRAAAQELRKILLHGPGMIVQADLGSLDSISRMVELLDDHSLDVLVNNAGVWKSTPLGSTSEGLLDELLNVNLRGMF